MHSPLNLEPVLSEPLDWKFRAFPAIRRPIRIGDVASQNWKLFESGFFFPVLVLKEAALENNLRAMARYCSARGVSLAPHGKTTMSPQIFERQLACGAWGMTAATVEHARIYRAFGVSRILLANELVREDEALWVRGEMTSDPTFDFLTYVDSVSGVRILSGLFDDPRRPLRVLVELGSEGGRTGCRTDRDALDVARAVAGAPGLSLSGTTGFEGILPANRAEGSFDAVDAFCDRLAGVGRALIELGRREEAEFIVSAGGSAFPDRVVERLSPFAKAHPNVRIVLRSGCYVTHDDGFYDRVSPFSARTAAPGAPQLRPALELWGAVLSRPESGLAVLGFGKRDAPFDLGLPVPHAVRSRAGGAPRSVDSMTVTRLNDQHAYLTVPSDDPLEPGDLVGCGVSHPCLAFDRWPLLPVVDDAYDVVGAIRTFF